MLHRKDSSPAAQRRAVRAFHGIADSPEITTQSPVLGVDECEEVSAFEEDSDDEECPRNNFVYEHELENGLVPDDGVDRGKVCVFLGLGTAIQLDMTGVVPVNDGMYKAWRAGKVRTDRGEVGTIDGEDVSLKS